MKWISIVALSLALCGCVPKVPPAVTATQPTAADVQHVRELASQAKGVATASIDFINALSEGINKVPMIPVAVKDSYDCTFMRVIGTKTPVSITVAAACGGPIPLAVDAPIAQAVKELDTVTTCPSLRTTISNLLRHVDPMIAKLEGSSDPTATTGALGLRTMFAFMGRLLNGGATCS